MLQAELLGQVMGERGDNLYKGRKFAVVTHVLPPEPSGQSVLLERLLRNTGPDSYCLIYNGLGKLSAGALSAKTHQIRRPFHLPVLRIPFLSRIMIFLNRIWEILDRALQIIRIIRQENCDLLIGCTGDLYNLPSTLLASLWTGRPYIAYILDDYIFQWTGSDRDIAIWLEPKFVKSANRIFVLNEFVRRCYVERYGVEPDVIHNPVLLPNLDQLDTVRTNPNANYSGVNIIYTGSIYHAHFDAFQNLVSVLQEFDSNQVKLHIYTSQPKDFLESKGITGSSVVYHPHIHQDEIFKVLRQADILFLPLAFCSNIPEVIQSSAPFKTSEYLAIGRPILVHVPADSFLSWYFRKYDCGVVVDRSDKKMLKDSLVQLLNDLELQQRVATNARRQAEIEFDINVIRPVFFDLLNQALDKP